MSIFDHPISWPVFKRKQGKIHEPDGVYEFKIENKKEDNKPRTGYILSAEDRELCNKWIAEHNKTCEYHDDGTTPCNPCGAIGGRFTYNFTPTGLGLITTMECACGEKLELTDFDMW